MTTHVYLILPESEPASTPWTKLNDGLLEYSIISEFLKSLEIYLAEIRYEEYQGKFDSNNINSFLANFDILEKCYPNPITRILQKILLNRKFSNVRSEAIVPKHTYKMFSQNLGDHFISVICEIHNPITANENFVLINFDAITVSTSEIFVQFEDSGVSLPNLLAKEQIREWFSQNRIPSRLFHDTSKHREQARSTWPEASQLLCSIDDAQLLLNTAIGLRKTLYNFDSNRNCWIKFMYDNVCIDNQLYYHGYNLDIDSLEVPNEIKKILSSR